MNGSANPSTDIDANKPASRILIVEDEAHLAQGLLFNLKAEGHDAAVAADGESALDLLLAKRETFDAVVLDVMLPGIDGFAVARAMREAQNYTPVLDVDRPRTPGGYARRFCRRDGRLSDKTV